MAWYKRNRVESVPKDCNPPNTPELRPIKRFWAIIKWRLLKISKPAKDIKDFQKKWDKAGEKFGNCGVQNL